VAAGKRKVCVIAESDHYVDERLLEKPAFREECLEVSLAMSLSIL